MLPDAPSQDLLYVSNLKRVTVYSYPHGRLEGSIEGFYGAQGECLDKKGDVFVTNLGTNQIIAYAHGAWKPLRALPGHALPEGCSVNPLTGDLAAADSDGTIAIYQNARGKPRIDTHSPLKQAFSCSYDDHGNLFVDGVRGDSSKFMLLELPKSGGGLKPVTLDQRMGYPGGVQWDGKYLAVGSYTSSPTGTTVVYRFKIAAGHGREVGATTLGSGASDVRQFWIQNATLVAPSEQLLRSDVFFYNYPTGGKARKTITHGLDTPAGAVVSPARSR